ncbi:MAG: hypothetical protein Q8P90_02180 [bacterium]|nr:hypothetical protein [bacterium]
MALYELHNILPINIPVSATTNPDFIEGQFCRVDADGNAVKAAGAAGTRAIGIVSDSSETSGGHTHSAADLVIGANGRATRSTSVRVSDMFNETLASGKVSVYIAGGQFESDQYEVLNGLAIISYVPGDRLYVSANATVTTIASANAQAVGTVTLAPRAYPSGVPGTDTTDGSMSWGNFIQFILDL